MNTPLWGTKETTWLRRIRFRPLLPLGRAKDWGGPPPSEALGAHADPMELVENGLQPVAGCGLGQNLYVNRPAGPFHATLITDHTPIWAAS